jgi:ABC-type branched-subunit amino acid transport system substrate-binding protein
MIDHPIRRRGILLLAVRAGAGMLGARTIAQLADSFPRRAVELRIGIIVPPGAAPADGLRGVTLGIEEAMHTGRLLGLVVTPVKREAAIGESETLRRLVYDRVHVVITGLLSAEQAASGDALFTEGIPIIDCADSQPPDVADACVRDGYAVGPSLSERIRVLLEFAARTRIRRFVLLSDGSAASGTTASKVRTRLAADPRLRLTGSATLDELDALNGLGHTGSESDGAVVLIAGPGEKRDQLLATPQQMVGAPVPVLDVLGTDGSVNDISSTRRGGETVSRPSRVIATPWHPSLERYGAAQLNDRYRARFGTPMRASAWLGWMAVKVAFESALRSRQADGALGVPDLIREDLRFDGHKGRPLTFDRGDHRLRQPLYAVDVGDQQNGSARSLVVEIPPADEAGVHGRCGGPP